ncbi:uncharacterized protein JCM6883_000203 [Sporobolomyces salmoneus]|uniref:uncharacterized protein n=1 Tax=Sporobolomyces salmoneus TaxID=183962 RepID=UPI00317EBF64
MSRPSAVTVPWPPLPSPPRECAVLSALPPSLVPPTTNLPRHLIDIDGDNDDPNSTSPFIFKGGGTSEQLLYFNGPPSLEQEKMGHCGGRARRMRIETVTGEEVPRMILDVRHRALTKLEAKHHAGVFVVKNRGDPETVVLEEMPFASRWGCYLLYHGLFRNQKLLNSIGVEKLFREWSEREGKKYDSTHNALHRILKFIHAYHIDCSELRRQDTRVLISRHYTPPTRKLKRDARKIAEPRNPLVISSAADCRLTVFTSVSSAEKLWIKGRDFKLEELVGSRKLARQFKNGCVAIFRLAPSDYHRYHSPVDAVVGETKHIEGKYYTVSSLIVRDPRFNPLGENKRDVTLLHHTRIDGTVSPIAFVQVGALLVSSIRQTVRDGAEVKRGDELGYFAYGGSTIVCVFEKGEVEWDNDLLRNSTGENEFGSPLETMVKVGERIGAWTR